MTKLKMQFTYAVLFVAVLFLSACGNSNSADVNASDVAGAVEDKIEEVVETVEEEVVAIKAGPEITSVYVCPMHCEGSGSDAEGKCPTCEMDYVFNAPYHSAYICPMHCDDSGADEAGTCPACKMDYVKNEHAGHSHG